MGSPCKGVQCLVLQILCGGQLRFSLCSGAIITRCWFQFISYLLVYSPAQLMQSYASHLLPSLPRCCSYLVFLCRPPQVYSYGAVSTCPLFWLLQPLLYSTYFAVHAWIAFCTVHAGIACLAFLTCDWSQLHAGIACLVYD